MVFSHTVTLLSTVEDSGIFQWISTYCGGRVALWQMEFNWDTSKVILVDRSTLNFSYVSQAAGFSEDLKHLETHGMFD